MWFINVGLSINGNEIFKLNSVQFKFNDLESLNDFINGDKGKLLLDPFEYSIDELTLNDVTSEGYFRTFFRFVDNQNRDVMISVLVTEGANEPVFDNWEDVELFLEEYGYQKIREYGCDAGQQLYSTKATLMRCVYGYLRNGK